MNQVNGKLLIFNLLNVIGFLLQIQRKYNQLTCGNKIPKVIIVVFVKNLLTI